MAVESESRAAMQKFRAGLFQNEAERERHGVNAKDVVGRALSDQAPHIVATVLIPCVLMSSCPRSMVQHTLPNCRVASRMIQPQHYIFASEETR